MHYTDMIFLIELGISQNLTYRDVEVQKANPLKTIVSLLTLSFGFYALVLLGEIYHRNTGIGVVPTADFVAGETGAYGKNYSICSFKPRILSG